MASHLCSEPSARPCIIRPVPSGIDRTKTTVKSVNKRKVAAYEDDELAQAAVNAALIGGANSKRRKKDEEKRMRQYRLKAPISYLDRLERVRTQRMFLIDRERRQSEDGSHEEEVFDLAGSTGNIYQVTITKVPTCTCPDNLKGNQCKHIVYILVNVLKVADEMQYQLAFLSTELNSMFAAAPGTPQAQSSQSVVQSSSPDNRKPIEGDCPVCMMEFENNEDIVWCRAACGNNIHLQCFQQWAACKAGQVKCVYCRTPWEGDPGHVKKISKMGKKNDEGYINVASQLGLSDERDSSSYYQPWARQQGHGWRDRYY